MSLAWVLLAFVYLMGADLYNSYIIAAANAQVAQRAWPRSPGQHAITGLDAVAPIGFHRPGAFLVVEARPQTCGEKVNAQ